ncbi:MAG: SusE domain-containing protein, partial [Williamsia sp.]|nr:SusE domain-containing protein [Williamsia sp.]
MKHTIAKSALFFFTVCLLFNYCKKDTRDIDENLTAVPSIFSPDDNLYIKLDPTANPTHLFSWDQARAADGSLVLYEVAFDQAGGDFSKPFYTKVSDGGGVQNQL